MANTFYLIVKQKTEEQNMKTIIHKRGDVLLIIFFITLAFTFTSCQKEQQLTQSAQTDLALQRTSLSRDLSSEIASVTGGGSGTFGKDLDGDGEIDGSHFGVGISISGNGSAKGHFECLMAGNADILGLVLMSVAGNVTSGSLNANGSVTFSGVATVNLGKSTMFKGVPFRVTVTAGTAGVGTLTLTVIGAFDGVPGDTNIGNGNYDLPTETVATGQIKIQVF
jgi:hypothetical protein